MAHAVGAMFACAAVRAVASSLLDLGVTPAMRWRGTIGALGWQGEASMVECAFVSVLCELTYFLMLPSKKKEDVSENCAECQFSWTNKVLSVGPSGTVRGWASDFRESSKQSPASGRTVGNTTLLHLRTHFQEECWTNRVPLTKPTCVHIQDLVLLMH